MESIHELLQTASNQINEAEGTLKNITGREPILEIELARLKELGCKFTKMNEVLQEKRVVFITKLCEVLLHTVGETSFMIRKNGLHEASLHKDGPLMILAGAGAGVVVRYRFTQDPANYSGRSEYPKFFAESGNEKAYECLCSSMIQTIKVYLKHSPNETSTQASILNELLREVCSLREV